MADERPLWDPKLTKILQTALDPRADENTRLTALKLAAELLERRGVDFHSVRVIYEGQDRFGNSERGERFAKFMDDAHNDVREMRKEVEAYRERLAVTEAFIKHIRKMLRHIPAPEQKTIADAMVSVATREAMRDIDPKRDA